MIKNDNYRVTSGGLYMHHLEETQGMVLLWIFLLRLNKKGLLMVISWNMQPGQLELKS